MEVKHLTRLNVVSFITLISILLLTVGCEDKENVVTKNAEGIVLDASEGYGVDYIPINLWINEYDIAFQITSDDSEVDWDAISEKDNIPYYPLTMENAYELIEFVYDIEISDDGQSSIPTYIQELIAEIKQKKSQYRYIAAFDWGGIILFNRISNKNFKFRKYMISEVQA